MMRGKPTPSMNHQALVKNYPIADLVTGWYFRVTERSAGVWDVEGRDIYGRTITKAGVVDEQAALNECIAFARTTVAQGSPE